MKQTNKAKPLRRLATALEKVIYPISKWLSVVAILSVVAMMFVVTADVFMRRFLNAPIFGAYEIQEILLIFVVFCSIGYVMSIKGHVVVDSLTRLYPRRLRMVVVGIAHFFSLAILALMCWRTAVHGLAMQRAGETLVLLGIPVSPFIFTVSFGCAIFFLVTLVQFIYTLAGTSEDSGETSNFC